MALIKPYGRRGCLPHPFTQEEMIILLFAALNFPTLTVKEIFQEICFHFHEVNARAISVVEKGCTSHFPICRGTRGRVLPNLDSAMLQYGLPLTRDPDSYRPNHRVTP